MRNLTQPQTLPISVVADAIWSDWTSWTECTLDCGSGTQQKHRSCSTAYNGGIDTCTGGADSMEQDCNTHLCPGIRALLLLCVITSIATIHTG